MEYKKNTHQLELPAKPDTPTISSNGSFDIQINGRYIFV